MLQTLAVCKPRLENAQRRRLLSFCRSVPEQTLTVVRTPEMARGLFRVRGGPAATPLGVTRGTRPSRCASPPDPASTPRAGWARASTPHAPAPRPVPWTRVRAEAEATPRDSQSVGDEGF